MSQEKIKIRDLFSSKNLLKKIFFFDYAMQPLQDLSLPMRSKLVPSFRGSMES